MTTPTLYKFETNAELKQAADLWTSNPTLAEETYGHISSWDTSDITSMNSLFRHKRSFDEDISSWQTGNVTNMAYMFENNVQFNQDLSMWDVSKVTTMNCMFNNCSEFNQDLSRWNVERVKDLSYFLLQASEFDNDLSSWNVSAVTNATQTFRLTKAFNCDISAWNISNVAVMNGMFENASAFDQELRWNIDHVAHTSRMFENCSGGIYHSEEYYEDLRTNGFPGLKELDAAVGIYLHDQQKSDELYGPISEWNVSRVESLQALFNKRHTFNADISAWDVSSVTNMSQLFDRCRDFDQDLSAWDVSSVKNMMYAFRGASAFNSDISSWNMASVEKIGCMFQDATIFNRDISSWNVSNVQDFHSMFSNAKAFNQNLSPWNVSNARSFNSMFNGATSMDQTLAWQIDETANVANMFHNSNGKIGEPPSPYERGKFMQTIREALLDIVGDIKKIEQIGSQLEEWVDSGIDVTSGKQEVDAQSTEWNNQFVRFVEAARVSILKMIELDENITSDYKDGRARLEKLSTLSKEEQVACICDTYEKVYTNLENDLQLLKEARTTLEKFTKIGIELGNGFDAIEEQIRKIDEVINDTRAEINDNYNVASVFAKLVV